MSLAQRESKVLGQFAARALTDRIKRAADDLWSLLLEAHEGKAWAALGYDTWNQYVQTEFQMSKQHSFRLLDQGRVIRALESAAESPIGDLSEYEARDLKPVLDEVTEAVRSRTNGVSKERAVEIVREEVEKARRVSSAKRGAKELMQELNAPDFDPEANRDRILIVANFKDALDRILRLPSPAELIPAFRPYQHEYVKALPDAIARLVAFQSEWEKAHG